ncbi:MAG: efflux RND transporter permease subunit [Candidatus Paracaedibacteraceae bacterium]|nr:efflux RND transporter permease subunit [Candidatus Paracaedibacteraceae bacterium]
MKLSEVCIQRPVLAWVLTLVVILMGTVGFIRLPVQEYPNFESVFLTIETQMTGAGPDIIETQITQVIEDAVSGVEGIDTISSVSTAGDSKVQVEFRPGIKMDNAVNDVRDRLARSKDKLPPAEGNRTDPQINRTRLDERPILILALTSDKAEPSELFDYADNDIKKVIESVSGVARVDVMGASEYIMQIELDPIRMSAHHVTVDDVYAAVKKQNVEAPAGEITSKNRKYFITTVATLEKPEEFEEIIVRQINGRMIRVKDIGKAYIQADDKRTRTNFNGKRGVNISIAKQSNTNPLEVADAVKTSLKDFSKRLPAGYEINIARDPTKFIQKSIRNVYGSIIEASILVVLVVLVFLRSARASIIPLITIPVSLIGVSFLMYMLGYSLNNFTLFAMVLAIGLVVDDSIVVLENIHRHIEDGVSPFQASIKGVREVGFSVIAMTLTLVAVYAPIPLGSGKMAKFFTEFAITLAGSVLISGFVALTLSPMMCSRLLTKTHEVIENDNNQSLWNQLKAKIRTDEWLDKLEVNYEQMLRYALSQRLQILSLAAAITLLGVWVYAFLRSEYIPQADTRSIQIEANAPQSATVEYTERHINDLDKILLTYPEIERRITIINNPTVDITIELVDEKSSLFRSLFSFFSKHQKKTEEIILELTKKFEMITGLDPKIRTGGGSSDANVVEFVVRGNKSQTELKDMVNNMVQGVYQSGIVQGVRAVNNNDNEDYIVTLQRDKISHLKRQPKDVSDTIEHLVKGRKAGKFKRNNKQYDVKLQVAMEFKETPEDILRLFMTAGTEKNPTLIPLSDLVSVDARTGPHEIHRYNRMRSSSISVSLKAGNTVGDGIKMVKEAAAEYIPEDTQCDFIGETKKFINDSKSMLMVFLLSICFIYLVMAAQFESWRDPFIIFFSVPLSLIGGVIALSLIDKGTLNMYSFIGFITLIGLITKHGILIVDFANRLRESGNTVSESVVMASKMRLRPILMTTLAMVFGAVPLMLGGAGGESRRQLGCVIIGGMSLGTIFTIFVVPVMYTYLTSKKRGLKNKLGHIDDTAHHSA